jgi:hypothetical protein
LWVDSAGEPLKSHDHLVGFTSYRTTKDIALRAIDELKFDLGEMTMVKVDRPLDRPHESRRAKYRARVGEGDVASVFGSGATQSVKLIDKHTVEISVQAIRPDQPQALATPDTPPTDDERAPNSLIQSDDPRVVELASQVAADENDPWTIARALERLVRDTIRNVNYSQAFLPAAEVAASREGDCTEHAVLLCALCRAAGIPARCAMGVLCLGSAWAGHAWVEVWIDGRWYALDGTLGQGSVDAAHITLARMTFKDTGFAEEFLGLLQGLANLEIDALEVALDGRAVRPDEEAARVEGDTYVNALWGIRFSRPRGWRFERPRAGPALTTRLMDLAGERGGAIAIDVADADADDWESVRKALVRAHGSAEETEVDGRPALRLAPEEGGTRVFALGPCGLFIFDGDARTDRAALEELLASVDFDVE